MPGSSYNRRDFLARSRDVGAATALSGLLPVLSQPVHAVSPNEKITVAIVGIHGRGALLYGEQAVMVVGRHGAGWQVCCRTRSK